MNRSNFRFALRYDAVRKTLSLFCVGALAFACLLSMGCDTGTYNQRLNEKPVEPVKESPETTESGDDGESPFDDGAADDQQ